MGLPNVPPPWIRYLEKHNLIGSFTARLVAAAESAGTPWAIENPADRGDASSPAYGVESLDSAARQRSEASLGISADRAAADTLVGRAVNLSQVFPELNSVLHGGYHTGDQL